MAARGTSNEGTPEPTSGTIDLSKLDKNIFYMGRGRGPGGGWAAEVIRSMKVDEPVQLFPPETTDEKGATSTMHAAAKRAGFKVAVRKIEQNGVSALVAMRLPDKDQTPTE